MSYDRDDYDIVDQAVERIVDLLDKQRRQRRRVFAYARIAWILSVPVACIAVPAFYGGYTITAYGVSLVILFVGSMLSMLLHYLVLRSEIGNDRQDLQERLMGLVLQYKLSADDYKPKRDSLRLTDDGELADPDDDNFAIDDNEDQTNFQDATD